MHEAERERDGDGDEQERDAAEMKHIAEQKARAEQDDSSLQPEFIGGYASLKDARNADGVGDDEAKDDGPENILDVRKGDVMSLGIGTDGFLDELSRVADGGQEQKTGDKRGEAAKQSFRPGRSYGECGHWILLLLAIKRVTI